MRAVRLRRAFPSRACCALAPRPSCAPELRTRNRGGTAHPVTRPCPSKPPLRPRVLSRRHSAPRRPSRCVRVVRPCFTRPKVIYAASGYKSEMSGKRSARHFATKPADPQQTPKDSKTPPEPSPGGASVV
ncbi:hypothetical protein GCM10020218_014500 [Dactylosporangium vinaceum]